jgi:neopullulanase
MKKLLSLSRIVIIQFLSLSFVYAQSSPIKRINPTNWWVGMKNPELQILFYGDKIGSHTLSLKKYKGVKLKKVHKVENQNYLFADLEIGATTPAGQLNFVFSDGKNQFTQLYELKINNTYQPQGVSPADFIYLLMPDRFANGDELNDKFANMADPLMDRNNPFLRHGGDLQGVANHLDYFTDLGVTALWLNPVIENDQPTTNEGGTQRSAYHGYGFTDHYNVDIRLGGNVAYKTMIDQAHKKGLKVIQDAVYNHAGINHWILKDMPFKEWLNQWDSYTQTSFKEPPVLDPHASKLDRKIMSDGWFMPFLPDLNQKNEFVAKFLIQHAIWTVEEFSIDAWRIDTYMYNDMAFMNRCNNALLNEYPQIMLFGESLASPVSNQAAFVKNNIKNLPFDCNLPSTLDNQLFAAMKDALKQKYGWSDGVNRLYNTLAQDYLYQNPEILVTYLDNHDEHRFLSEVGENYDKYKMGLAWLMTTRGIPQIYYGTELGVKNFKDPTDAEVRKDFVGGWKDDKENKFTKDGRNQLENEIYDFVKTLAHYRKNSEAIAKGSLMQFMPFDEGVYVYFRYTDHQKVMVISNTSEKEKVIDMKRFKEQLNGATTAKNIMNSHEIMSLENLKIQPQKFYILEIQ